ncbi:MAG TPA: DoxX family protein [Bacteroidetes bacterium]|nr:DoxX family protein [Bacteroidota bacterium]
MILIGRLLLGGFFINSGFKHFSNLTMMAGYSQSKGIPSPKAAVVFSGLLLLIGGLSILLGVYPTVGTIALVLFLVPVTFMMHAFWKVKDPMARMGETVNFTKNLALLGAALMLLGVPQPWAVSLF